MSDTIYPVEYLNSSLDEKKQWRMRQVDKRTGELISEGFIYDSIQFSMSSLAQTNWIGLKQAAQNNLITYPFGISTKDDGEYLLTNSADVTSFYTTGLGTKIGHLATGRALKLQLKATTTEAELDAIVDTR